jgi:acetylornithine/succinyldiaminopimelate/putrescine aminotransferase
MNQREIFLNHIAQTSSAPIALEIVTAEGIYLEDVNGKKYMDIIGGISVANIGHRHPRVIAAISEQLKRYLHIMVYGEFVQSPQTQYAQLLANHLPGNLNCVYFTNSGAEAVEGAMKLAKKYTGRREIIAFKNSYHGSTQGALSIIGSEYWRNAFRPLLPGVLHLDYNDFDIINHITENTACIILETVQAEAGIIKPSVEWMQAIREKCTQTGTLLILDEIQTGFGRTGTLWGFENFGVVPDILLLGKALGGGMPLGAFIADFQMMNAFTDAPVLGHITTFGGHPVSCVAGMAAMQALLDEKLLEDIPAKEEIFLSRLRHPDIKNVRSAGLWLSLQFDSFETNKKIIDTCIENGLLTDWFLFAADSLRISPPLNITEAEIHKACDIILDAVNERF